MSSVTRNHRRVVLPVFAVSIAAWGILVARAGTAGLTASCCVPISIQDGLSSSSLGMMLERNSPATLALGWGLMILAMMGPLMPHAILYVTERSLARRRVRSVALFLAAYFGSWMAVGAIFLPAALVIRLFEPVSFIPAIIAFALALVWEFSPWKQKCLNRGHRHPPLSTFGTAADLSILRFGFGHSVWCIGSCGPLMFASELLPIGHLPAMALITIWLVAEKSNRPAIPKWRLRGIGKSLRSTYAQVKMRLGTRTATQ